MAEEPDLHNQTLGWSIAGHVLWILSCIAGVVFLLWRDQVYILRKSFVVLLATEVIASIAWIIRDSAFLNKSQGFLTMTWAFYEALGLASTALMLASSFVMFSHQVHRIKIGIKMVVGAAFLYSVLLVVLVALKLELEIYLYLFYNMIAMLCFLIGFGYAYYQEVKILSTRSTKVGIAMVGCFIGLIDFIIYCLGAMHVSIHETTFIWKTCDAFIFLPFVLPAIRVLDQCWCMKDIASQLFSPPSQTKEETIGGPERPDEVRKLGIVQQDFDEDSAL